MTEQDVKTTDPSNGDADERRTFIAKITAIAVGSVAAIGPFVVGLRVFLDPIFRTVNGGSNFVRVATLDAIPDDGIPRAFPVVKVIESQFTTYPRQPVGRVFLRREKGQSTVTAFHATCTHAGCDVEFQVNATNAPGKFNCPCHNSQFSANGSRINPESCPAPRDLDTLDVDQAKLKDGEVWIDFKNYRAATHDKIPT